MHVGSESQESELLAVWRQRRASDSVHCHALQASPQRAVQSAEQHVRRAVSAVDVLRRLWWLFAIDAIVLGVEVLTFSPESSLSSVESIGLAVLNLGMVAAIGYFAARYSGRLQDAFKAGLIFWFIWRPIWFFLTSAISSLVGGLD